MALLGRDGDDVRRTIIAEGVTLRHPDIKHFAEWATLRERSRAFLTPWEPTWPDDELTREAFRARLRRYTEDIRDGRSFPFFVFCGDTGALVGGATLSRVQRGVAQSCSLGYWVGEPFQRRGYTLAAARALTEFAFDDLALHRVEAACVPENAPSQALLLKAGFEREGLAKAYLRINGRWRDHLLFGLVRPDA